MMMSYLPLGSMLRCKLQLLAAGLLVVTASAQDNAPQRPTAVEMSVPQWQTMAGGKMSFEVASIRQNKTGGKSSMNVDPHPRRQLLLHRRPLCGEEYRSCAIRGFCLQAHE
jgi:hypothetical protein